MHVVMLELDFSIFPASRLHCTHTYTPILHSTADMIETDKISLFILFTRGLLDFRGGGGCMCVCGRGVWVSGRERNLRKEPTILPPPPPPPRFRM